MPYFISLGLIKPSPTKKSHIKDERKPLEKAGPFNIWYHWSRLDFAYPSDEDRHRAIVFEEFIPENNLPLGLEVYKDRLFMTMPKWKPGVPCTLAVLPKVPKEASPKLVPYPSWNWHKSGTYYQS